MFSIKSNFIYIKIRYWYYIYVRVLYARFKLRHIHIRNHEETIDEIMRSHSSVCRFGDGELDIIIHKWGNGFQPYDSLLDKRLKEILTTPKERVLVCIPRHFKETKGMVLYSKNLWRFYIVRNLIPLLDLLSPDITYYDTQVTRFYIPYKDKGETKKKYVEHLKEIWQGRDIVIVEGYQTRSGIGNNLYANAKSVKRILCPSVNAFEKYDILLEAVFSNVPKDNLILICAGMTATVLAYDLANEGYQAIDLGHLDVEYEWCLCGAKEKIALPNKYVNEVTGGDKVMDVYDATYISQIIVDVSKL